MPRPRKIQPKAERNWLTITALAHKLGTGLTKTWSLVKEGVIPKPVYLGRRSPRWDEEEIDACLKALGERQATRKSAFRHPDPHEAQAGGVISDEGAP